MTWLDDYKMRLVLVGFVAVIVLGGESTRADFTFGEPVNLGPPINTGAGEVPCSISPDGLELYFMDAYALRPGNLGGHDIWVARRPSVSEAWEEPLNLGAPINTEYDDAMPYLSSDGLTLYFSSDRPGGNGESDLYVSTRMTKDDPWEAPMNLGAPVSGPAWDSYPFISADGLTLYFTSEREGGSGDADTWVATRATTDETWGEPVNLGSVMNSPDYDSCPYLSPGDLALFFHSWRPGGGGLDIWVAMRTSSLGPWEPPVPLPVPINSEALEAAARVSADGLTLYFSSDRPGGEGDLDVWQAPVIPVVDLNKDGIVDAADLCIVVDHWGENYPLCDIGPTPWGDGIVDVQDLIVLAEHLFEVVPPAEPVE